MIDKTGRYVVHLPLRAADHTAAADLARVMARTLAIMPGIDAPEATVSEEDDQTVRHRLFCDRLLDGGRRCVLRADHRAPCTRRDGWP